MRDGSCVTHACKNAEWTWKSWFVSDPSAVWAICGVESDDGDDGDDGDDDDGDDDDDLSRSW